MSERLRRPSNSEQRAKELKKRASKIELREYYSRDDLQRLRKSAGEVIKPEHVDSFLKERVVVFGKMPKDDPRKADGLVGYVDNIIAGLNSPTAT
jgi:hypothetical protein